LIKWLLELAYIVQTRVTYLCQYFSNTVAPSIKGPLHSTIADIAYRYARSS